MPKTTLPEMILPEMILVETHGRVGVEHEELAAQLVH